MNEQLLQLIYTAIDDVDARTAAGEPVRKAPESDLLGSEKGVDSLTFVNLVVSIEEGIQNTMSKSVVLVDEDGMALQEHPFRTIGTLALYLDKIVSRH